MTTLAARPPVAEEGCFRAAGGLDLFWVRWPSAAESDRDPRETVVLVHALGNIRLLAYPRLLRCRGLR